MFCLTIGQWVRIVSDNYRVTLKLNGWTKSMMKNVYKFLVSMFSFKITYFNIILTFALCLEIVTCQSYDVSDHSWQLVGYESSNNNIYRYRSYRKNRKIFLKIFIPEKFLKMENTSIDILKGMRSRSRNKEFHNHIDNSIKFIEIYNRGKRQANDRENIDVVDNKIIDNIIDDLEGCVVARSDIDHTVISHDHDNRELFQELISVGVTINNKVQNVQNPAVCRVRFKMKENYERDKKNLLKDGSLDIEYIGNQAYGLIHFLMDGGADATVIDEDLLDYIQCEELGQSGTEVEWNTVHGKDVQRVKNGLVDIIDDFGNSFRIKAKFMAGNSENIENSESIHQLIMFEAGNFKIFNKKVFWPIKSGQGKICGKISTKNFDQEQFYDITPTSINNNINRRVKVPFSYMEFKGSDAISLYGIQRFRNDNMGNKHNPKFNRFSVFIVSGNGDSCIKMNILELLRNYVHRAKAYRTLNITWSKLWPSQRVRF